jgi:hypothetical protein
MLDVLQEFDILKLRKPVSSDTHQYIGIAVAADTSPVKSITVMQKPSKKFVALPQFSLTKYDHYMAVSEVERALVQDGRNMKHTDIGKLSKLKEYQKFITHELTVANCPSSAPDEKRLQIFRSCFEKLIQDLSSHGELLSEIKVSIIYFYLTNYILFIRRNTKSPYLSTKIMTRSYNTCALEYKLYLKTMKTE